MSRKSEVFLLRALFIFGFILFVPLVRRKPVKDMNEWLLVFFIKSYISTFVDTILNKKGYVRYPVNLVHHFNTSVLFNYLLFPIACVYYNQLTKHSSLVGILIKVFFISFPMSIIEDWLEKNTQLVKYSRGWSSKVSFYTLTLTFWLVRGLMALIRRVNKEGAVENSLS
ncbi:CBO0543 family protein [Bacillus tuaregi]|uniref:CBO0543 family protein n=1 Tax=Bacillus tuaregi TaxID=1816695 RepID=UPI0008F81AF7|nr:CBO0543 family protein [Bacillus tuaregi]